MSSYDELLNDDFPRLVLNGNKSEILLLSMIPEYPLDKSVANTRRQKFWIGSRMEIKLPRNKRFKILNPSRLVDKGNHPHSSYIHSQWETRLNPFYYYLYLSRVLLLLFPFIPLSLPMCLSPPPPPVPPAFLLVCSQSNRQPWRIETRHDGDKSLAQQLAINIFLATTVIHPKSKI